MLDFANLNRILFKGDENTAYRDPAAFLHKGVFHVFFTLVEKACGVALLYLAKTESKDLINFSPVRKLTPGDTGLNYSSPGNIIEYGGEFWLCFQSYPRENGEKYANGRARLFTVRTKDFCSFSSPELLPVKGNIPAGEMGRMIDPFLVRDKDDKDIIYCFYKQNGVSISRTRDMVNWEFCGNTDSGENACVIVKNNTYYLFHSPEDNGIAIKKSDDLIRWEKVGGLITLGAHEHEWSKGRVTAGFVLDLYEEYGKYLMFYHASGPETEKVYFDNYASLALRVSDDLLTWE